MMIIDHPHRCVQWPRSKIICTKGSDMMIMGRGLHTNERAARSSQICAKDWNVFKTFVTLHLSTLDSSIRLSLIWMFSPSLKLGRRILSCDGQVVQSMARKLMARVLSSYLCHCEQLSSQGKHCNANVELYWWHSVNYQPPHLDIRLHSVQILTTACTSDTIQ